MSGGINKSASALSLTFLVKEVTDRLSTGYTYTFFRSPCFLNNVATSTERFSAIRHSAGSDGKMRLFSTCDIVLGVTPVSSAKSFYEIPRMSLTDLIFAPISNLGLSCRWFSKIISEPSQRYSCYLLWNLELLFSALKILSIDFPLRTERSIATWAILLIFAFNLLEWALHLPTPFASSYTPVVRNESDRVS